MRIKKHALPFLMGLFLLVSCAKEEDCQQLSNHLTIDVTLNSPATRAVVDGRELPEGSNIGIAMQDADGGLYDGQTGIGNVRFQSEGSSPAYWRGEKYIQLSNTPGTVYGYHPYQSGVTKIDSIPLDMKNQDDQMFATPVSGVCTTSANVQLKMNHALAAIRLEMIRGSYSHKGEVNSISVISNGAAARGTMNGKNGLIRDLDGIGEEIFGEVNPGCISSNVLQETVLVIPTGQTDKIQLRMRVDGSDYYINVPATTLQAGHMYTYTIQFASSYVSLEQVAVALWNEESLGIFQQDPVSEQYIVVKTTSDNSSVKITHKQQLFSSILCDETHEELIQTGGSGVLNHTFAKAGLHKLWVTFANNVTDASQLFYDCRNLVEISEGLFFHATDIEDFSSAFYWCSNLQRIPPKLFFYNTFAKKFINTFSYSGITSVPADLFCGNTQITSVNNCFSGCTQLQRIEGRLFALSNPQLTTLNDLFTSCVQLTEVPVDLLHGCDNVTTIDGLFDQCRSLEHIPDGLFAGMDQVTTITDLFIATGLKTPSVHLFDGLTGVKNARSLFSSCSGLVTLPSDLLAPLINLETLDYCFQYCGNLKELPGDLFAHNTKIYRLGGTFSYCRGLTEIPEKLLHPLTKMIATEYSTGYSSCGLFHECSGLTSIPANLFVYNTELSSVRGCFKNCTSLKSIPEKLFSNNPKLYDFGSNYWKESDGCFEGCTGLSILPEDLFAYAAKIDKLSCVFMNCTGLTEIPENLFKENSALTKLYAVFKGCTGLTTIPEGLFAHNPELTEVGSPSGPDIYGCFQNCTSLRSVPAALFANNPKAESFCSLFSGCTALEGESPYTLVGGEKAHLYERGNYPDAYATPYSFRNTFTGCESLADYEKIPNDWKGL